MRGAERRFEWRHNFQFSEVRVNMGCVLVGPYKLNALVQQPGIVRSYE